MWIFLNALLFIVYFPPQITMCYTYLCFTLKKSYPIFSGNQNLGHQSLVPISAQENNEKHQIVTFIVQRAVSSGAPFSCLAMPTSITSDIKENYSLSLEQAVQSNWLEFNVQNQFISHFAHIHSFPQAFTIYIGSLLSIRLNMLLASSIIMKILKTIIIYVLQ